MKYQRSRTLLSKFAGFVIPTVCITGVAGEGFLSHTGGQHHARKMAMLELESIVSSALDSDADKAISRQFAKIEASMENSFLSLPKMTGGGLAPRAVRHLVHSYFAKEHGWLINGLEFTGMRTDDAAATVHDVDVLQDKAPALVEALLEAQSGEEGLSLHRIAAMVMVLERLIYDESLELLQSVWDAHSLRTDSEVNQHVFQDVLLTYIAMFRLGPDSHISKFAADDVRNHVRKTLAEATLDSGLVAFQRSARLHYDYHARNSINPFVARQYTFTDARKIGDAMAEDYGKWQDEDCQVMKYHLMSLDPTHSGRVDLNTFHGASTPPGQTYAFAETAEQLKNISALEQLPQTQDRVLVVNYLISETNCLPASSYFSICCLHECELLMNELESKVRAPTARPELLLDLVSNLSSSSVDAPRSLRPEMVERLHMIAIQNGGEVPLHGRLFRQWLHYAFPYECPFPHAQVLQSRENEDKTEIQSADTAYWSDEEILPLQEEWVAAANGGGFGNTLRMAGRVLSLIAGLRVALALAGKHVSMNTLFNPKASKAMAWDDKAIHFA